MELRQLRYFLAVARTLNFTRAAEEVHIAQPPLSRQIANLEEELGVLLLERGPRSLTLTPAGEFFAAHAGEILQRIQRLKEDTSAMARGGGAQTLRTGLELSLLYSRAPTVVKHLRQLYPDLRVEMEVFPAERLLPALKDGEIDIALGRGLVTNEDIEQRVIRKEALVLAFPPGHRAETCREGGVTLVSFCDETFLLHTATATAEADTIRRLYDDAGVPSNNRVTLRDLSAVLGLVAAGGGLAIVPAVAERLRHGDVLYAPINDSRAETPVVLSVASARHRPYFNAIFDESVRLLKLEEAAESSPTTGLPLESPEPDRARPKGAA